MMTDPNAKSKRTGSGTLLPTLAIILSVATLICALLSFVAGSRLAAMKTAAFVALESKSQPTDVAPPSSLALTSELEATKKDLATKRAETAKLRKELDSLWEATKSLKADLATANQTIANLRGTQGTAPSPAQPSPQPPPAATPAPAQTSPVDDQPPVAEPTSQPATASPQPAKKAEAPEPAPQPAPAAQSDTSTTQPESQ